MNDASAPIVGANAQRYRRLIRPNRSLSRPALQLILLVYGVTALGVGIGAGWIGAWLVLPFIGLESVVVVAVVYVVSRHYRDYELLSVDADRLYIVRRTGSRRTRHEFLRCWARVVLAQGERDWYPSRLLITSHGNTVEVGAWMTDDQRRTLARDLTGLLGSALTR